MFQQPCSKLYCEGMSMNGINNLLYDGTVILSIGVKVRKQIEQSV